MKVFRLAKAAFAKDLSGRGAETSGGRWNSKGVPMVYTSASRALCTLEIAVNAPLGILPKDYSIVTIEVPDEASEALDRLILPVDWRSLPHSDTTQQIGNAFVEKASALMLKVPSAIVGDEFNYLINPAHQDMDSVRILEIAPFTFDTRLFLR